jgi:hypothetical protein
LPETFCWVEVKNMGADQSVATSTNILKMSNTTNISSTQNCYNSQVTEIDTTNVRITNTSCDGKVTINNFAASFAASCQQNLDISVLVKNVLDQQATSKATTSGLAFNLFNNSIANSTNIMDVQNNIGCAINANCANSQRNVIKDRVVVVDGLNSNSDCEINNIGITAQMACANSAKVNLTTDNDIKQTATSTATAGLDLGQLLMFLMLFFGGGLLIALFGIMMKVVLKGDKPKTEVPLAALAVKLAGLKAQVNARAAKLARQAASAQAQLNLRPPPAAVPAVPAAIVSSSPFAPTTASPLPRSPFAG